MADNDKIELAVIGSILLKGMCEELPDFSHIPEDLFQHPEARHIFKNLLQMYNKGQIINPESLKILEPQVDIQKIINSVEVFNLNFYVNLLKEKKTDEDIEQELAILKMTKNVESAKRLADLIEKRNQTEKSHIVKAETLINEFQNYKEDFSKNHIPTGFNMIDDKLHACASDLITVGGRTGEGKTTYLTNILINIVKNKIPCLYCPTEMKPLQFFSNRILPLLTFIPAWRFRQMKLSEIEMLEIHNIIQPLKEMPLFLLDRAGPDIDEIKKAVMETQSKVVFVDYLGRCSMPREATRMREIEKFVVELKNFCITSQIVCFMAVQLARRVDFEENAAPRLADLSDSSSIEKESDAVIMLWRNKKNQTSDFNNLIISAMFRKNRYGYLSNWTLNFNRELMQMTEIVEAEQLHQKVEVFNDENL